MEENMGMRSPSMGMRSPSMGMQSPASILIVDDDEVVVSGCLRVLGQEGFKVKSAQSVAEAKKLIGAERFDVVITDVMMPDEDGFVLVRWAKAEHPYLGIVIITGFASQQSIRDAIDLHIIDFLPKPFSPVMLAEVAQKAVGVARLKTSMEKPAEAAASDKVNEIIQRYKGKPGALMPVLQQVQEVMGYLPPSVQKLIAKGLKMPVSEIHSVVSFYPHFTMKVRGRHNIKVCVGGSCFARQADSIMENIKGYLKLSGEGITEDKRFSLESAWCVGACGFAPVVEIDHDTHGGVNPDKVEELLKPYE